MKEVALALPMFAFTIATRAAIGVGIGLLVSERIAIPRRRAIGGALVAVGALTTVPILMSVRRNLKPRRYHDPIGIDRSERLIGATRFARKGDEIY